MNRSPTRPWLVGEKPGSTGSVGTLQHFNRQGSWSFGPLTEEPHPYPGSYGNYLLSDVCHMCATHISNRSTDPMSSKLPAVLETKLGVISDEQNVEMWRQVMDFKAGENVVCLLYPSEQRIFHADAG